MEINGCFCSDLALALSNKHIQDNLRDGLPYPYTEKDGIDYISAMLSANENDTFAFAIVKPVYVGKQEMTEVFGSGALENIRRKMTEV